MERVLKSVGYNKYISRGLDHFLCTAESQKPLLHCCSGWISVKENVGKRMERAKDKATRVSSTINLKVQVSLENSVMVVGHQVTKDGVKYLVKGAQETGSVDSERKCGLLSCITLHKMTEGSLMLNITLHVSFTLTVGLLLLGSFKQAMNYEFQTKLSHFNESRADKKTAVLST